MKANINKYYSESLYRNSIMLILNSSITAFFGLLFWIIVARTLSSNEMGLSTTAISAATLIMALSRLGLDQGLIRYLPELENKSSFYSAVNELLLLFSIVISIIFLGSISKFSPILSFLRHGWFLPTFFLYISMNSILSVQNTAFIAIRRADLCMAQNILQGLRIPLLFFLVHLGVLGVFSSYGISFLLALLFGAFILHKHGLSITRGFDTSSILKALKFSFGNYSASIITMVPVTIIPIMIANTIGAQEGAYFFVAYSIASLLFMIPNAVSTSLFVEGSHNLPLKENVIKSAKLILVLLVPILVITLLFGDRFLILYSAEYSKESFEMLQLLATSSIFSAVISIFTSIKRVQKDVRIINYVNFVLSVLIIGIGYIALLKYGLLGLGYAWLGAHVAVCSVILGLIIFIEKWS